MRQKRLVSFFVGITLAFGAGWLFRTRSDKPTSPFSAALQLSQTFNFEAPSFTTQPASLPTEAAVPIFTPQKSIAAAPLVPDFYELQRSQRQTETAAKVDKEYAELFSSIGSQGKAVGKMRELLIERQMIATDTFDIARARGLNMQNEEEVKKVWAIVDVSLKQYSEELRIALGEDYNTLKRYEATKPERHLIDALENRLNSSSDRLTANQRKTFFDTLYKIKDSNGMRMAKNVYKGSPFPARPDGGPVRMIPETGIDALRSILTPVQLEKLQDVYNEQYRTNVR